MTRNAHMTLKTFAVLNAIVLIFSLVVTTFPSATRADEVETPNETTETTDSQDHEWNHNWFHHHDNEGGSVNITKILINNHGGKNVLTDFGFTIQKLVDDWQNVESGNFVDGGSTISLEEGYYRVVENEHEGYAVSYENCEGEASALGDCVVTNDDIAPVLTLTALVNSTSTTVSAFTLTASTSGNTVLTGPSGVSTGPDFQAGAYTLGFTGPTGYTGTWACDLTGTNGLTALAGNTITLEAGDTIPCVLTLTTSTSNSGTEGNNQSDLCPNVAGVQATVPEGWAAHDGICTGPGGGQPQSFFGSDSTGNGGGGSVLGAATSTGEVLGESCGLYMNKHLRLGSKKNDVEQTKKLQTFLNKWVGSTIPVTGFFGPATVAALKTFQEKYGDEILKPWGVNMPTGLVYLTTLYKINKLECPSLTAELPPLVEWSKNPNAQ